MKSVLIMGLLIVVAGCSNRAVYENIQMNKKHECQQVPLSEYDRCMEGVEKSYDEYERERQEYLKKGGNTDK